MSSKMILFNGIRCSGKSTTSKELWKTLDRTILLDLDALKWNYSSYDKENLYSIELAHEVALRMIEVYASKGLDIIIEKAFTIYDYIEPYILLGKKLGLDIIVVNIEAPLEVLLERNKTRIHVTPKEKRVTKEELIKKNFIKYNENKFKVDFTYDTSNFTVSKIVKDLRKNIFNSHNFSRAY